VIRGHSHLSINQSGFNSELHHCPISIGHASTSGILFYWELGLHHKEFSTQPIKDFKKKRKG